jgi:putative iron-only hydrogenase system regulator
MRPFFAPKNIKEVVPMETRVATVGIIVEDMDSVEPLNALLHDYGRYIIGRMGIPYRDRRISVIMVAMDAPSGRDKRHVRQDRPPAESPQRRRFQRGLQRRARVSAAGAVFSRHMDNRDLIEKLNAEKALTKPEWMQLIGTLYGRG